MQIAKDLQRLATGVSGTFTTIAGAWLVAGGMRRRTEGEPTKWDWIETVAGSALVVAGLMALVGLGNQSDT